MPGVYVRTLSQLDWFDQEKESLINIPGSYWLCHKKNIYKFIFRYHRTMKNTVQFSYGRELLKIIRRIIKCHPTQGQQFGTQHLLVIYNCTSWTRQDKMFALLKFQQQNNAAAFSYAFVLTIKICSSSEQSLFDLKYPIVREADAGSTFKDLNDALDDEEATKIVIHTPDKMSSKKSAISQGKKMNKISKYNIAEDTLNKTSETLIDFTLQNNIEKSTNLSESTGTKIESATTCITIKKHLNDSIEFHDNTYVNKSINCNTTFENVKQNLVDQKQIRTTQMNDEVGIYEANCTDHEMKYTKIQKQHQKIQNIQKVEVFSPSKSLLTETIKQNSDDVEKSLSDKSNSDNNIGKKQICVTNNENCLNKEKTANEKIADSSSVLCQHFTQKEFEAANDNTRASSSSLPLNISMQNGLGQGISKVKSINEDFASTMVDQQNNDEAIRKKQYDKISGVSNKKQDKQQISMKAENKREQNNMYSKTYKARKRKNRESERKSMTNDKTLRSSDITDLVMEGLMFTIRQGQDSVAVIEQKTKLEVDEVLENSEKVETEAGEKCLLNSSLLRLENLITMIDSPRDKNQQFKTGCMISSDAFSTSCNTFNSNSSCNLNDISRTISKSNIPSFDRHKMTDRLSVDKSQLHQSTDSNITNIDSYSTNKNIKKKRKIEQMMDREDNDNEQDKRSTYKNNVKMEKVVKVEEKDIVSKVLQSTVLSSEKTNVDLQIANTLINNVDVKEAVKYDASMEDSHNAPCTPNSNKSSTEETFKPEVNVPRVISNKAITIEQIPQALQKALALKYPFLRKVHGLSLTVNSETSLAHNMRKTQNKTFAKNTTTKMSASTKGSCVNSDTVNKSLEIMINAEKMKIDKNESRVTIKKDNSEIDDNVCIKNFRKKNDKTFRTSSTSSLLKHGSSRKLQDITEDFYYDLHEHNKDNAIQQKYSRQKRKVLNNPEDVANGEVRIDMLKFIQDMTEGVKVVVKRLNVNNKSSLL